MKTYNIYLEKYAEYAVVEQIRHPVVVASGLPSVRPYEVVIFETNQLGQVLSINGQKVEVLLFTREPVRVGTKVARTGKSLTVGLGDYLLGQVISPLGKLLTTSSGIIHPEEEREIDVPPRKLSDRRQITEPLLSGVGLVDLLLPLGKGQRELVTGDRKTGKSSFLLSAIKTQVLSGSLAVYAAIGKRAIEIEQFRQFFKEEQLTDHVIMVVASSMEAQTMSYLAPFTAMTIAEYFRDKGRDVLVVLDDLSTHAKFYREISLLGKRFPGRDSYPGDIFFTHARLLERAGNYVVSGGGEAAISCLPVAETLENDLTDYIVSNLISITDGHILFDSTEFVKGRRPAINPTLSVTRVGKQTRTVLHQDINLRLFGFLGKLEKTAQYSHFGAELTADVKSSLERGNKLYAFFNQPSREVVPMEIQLVLLALVWQDSFNHLPDLSIAQARTKFIEAYQSNPPFQQLVTQLVNVVKFTDLLAAVSEQENMLLETAGIKK